MKKIFKNKKITCFLLLAIFVFTLVPFNAQVDAAKKGTDEKVAFVNLDAVVNNYPGAKESYQALEREAQASFDQFQQKAKNMTPEQQVALYQQKSQEMIEKEKAVSVPIKQNILKVIADIAKEKGFSIVLTADINVLGGTDITEEVIARVK